MKDKFIISLEYGDHKFDYIVNIDRNHLQKFVDDSLEVFDTSLRNIVSLDKYGEPFQESDENRKVAIDDIIEALG